MDYHAIETVDGWYTVSIDLDTDDFILTTPEARQVADCLNEIHFRENLYQHYEDGMIYGWLMLVRDKINRVRSNTGETRTWFKIDDNRYDMQVLVELGKVWLTLPRQTRVFNVEEMYIVNPDLPVIMGGALDDEVRRRLQSMGLEEMPRIPYRVGLGISPKKESTNNEKT
jgi:hypothetical protein